MVSERAKETIEKLESGKYQNSREIVVGNVPFSARDILIKAPLIARLNNYLVGGTGRGKSELLNEVVEYFGDRACYAIGRRDLEHTELLRQIRLDRLKDAKTDRELIELTENARKNFFGIEEINRAPSIIQNYFLDFGEGRIMHLGKAYPLGTEGYSVLWATGNLGDGEYVAISDTDRALKDRMHMILKSDHPDYRPTPLNLIDVFKGKKDPRLNPSQSNKANASDIIALHKEFLEREAHPIYSFLGVYLCEGLDFLENVPGHSKIACDARWPNLEGIRDDTDENKIFPLSPRAVLSTSALASALQMIAEAKGQTPDPAKLFIDSLRLTIPYSGVFSKPYISIIHNENVYSAFDSLFGEDSFNREEITRRASKLEEAIAMAEAGMINSSLLDEISPASIQGRWAPVRKAIEGYAEGIQKNPSEKSRKLREIIEEIHKLPGEKIK